MACFPFVCMCVCVHECTHVCDVYMCGMKCLLTYVVKDRSMTQRQKSMHMQKPERDIRCHSLSHSFETPSATELMASVPQQPPSLYLTPTLGLEVLRATAISLVSAKD